MPKYIRYYTSKSCKDDRCITVGAIYGKKIISSLQDFVVWYMRITVSVAYGYVHFTPAALKLAGKFTDNQNK